MALVGKGAKLVDANFAQGVDFFGALRACIYDNAVRELIQDRFHAQRKINISQDTIGSVFLVFLRDRVFMQCVT